MNGAMTLGGQAKVFSVTLRLKNYDVIRVLRDNGVEDPEEKAVKFYTMHIEAYTMDMAMKAAMLDHKRTRGNSLTGYVEANVHAVAECMPLDINIAKYLAMDEEERKSREANTAAASMPTSPVGAKLTPKNA